MYLSPTTKPLLHFLCIQGSLPQRPQQILRAPNPFHDFSQWHWAVIPHFQFSSYSLSCFIGFCCRPAWAKQKVPGLHDLSKGQWPPLKLVAIANAKCDSLQRHWSGPGTCQDCKSSAEFQHSWERRRTLWGKNKELRTCLSCAPKFSCLSLWCGRLWRSERCHSTDLRVLPLGSSSTMEEVECCLSIKT